jgi:acyl dehydratase
VKTIPGSVTSLIGVPQYEEVGEFPVERGYIWTVASSVENGNPLYWDDDVAEELTGGPIAPPTMISAWQRPHHWVPGRVEQKLPFQVHFDLKELLGTPEAIMSENTLVFYEPVRPGDVLTTVQVLTNVSEEKTLKIGTGHFWDIDAEYRNQHGELCARESITGFGYNRPEAS